MIRKSKTDYITGDVDMSAPLAIVRRINVLRLLVATRNEAVTLVRAATHDL
jgi:hypothetical protein